MFLWITGSAYAVVHDGDAVLSSAMFQRRDLVYLGNLIHLSDTYCASAKVYGCVAPTRTVHPSSHRHAGLKSSAGGRLLSSHAAVLLQGGAHQHKS